MTKTKEENILEAALKLFAMRGYDGTTVPMIAENAKVGAGTIYRYFESKESLVNSLFQKCVLSFSETVKNNFPEESSIREQFHHIFFQMFQFAKRNIDALLFIESHCEGYYLDEKSKLLFNNFLDFFRETLKHGKEQGIISPLPSDALIAIVYGAFVRLFKTIQLGGLEETPQLLKDVEESCWNAIRVI